jgi:hypothetical protein
MVKTLFRSTLMVLLVAAGCHGALTERGTSETILPENRPMMKEVYRVRIPNNVGATIEVSEDKGISWKKIGNVIIPADRVSDQGYTASRWVDDGDIAAVAVNAIHIKTDFNYTDDKGVIFNILPRESLPNARAASPEAGIFTTIKAGNSIFGGGYSPLVGNKVSVVDTNGNRMNISTGFVPKRGDVFMLIVERPVRYPREIIFENRFGGLIEIRYLDGEKRYIGQVLRPIEGVGRFIGTEYADVGRIRANHAGVICIATSPLGMVGGFQIIPAGHGMSKEMITARTLTQWMVIGPLSALDPSYEGMAPFFRYYLQPRYTENDIDQKDWKKRLLERFLVQVKYRSEPYWQPMPTYYMDPNKALPKWANTAMEGVTHIRILFPIYQ